MIAAIGEREVGLGLRADGADDMRAERPRPLAGEQADAAGRGMDQDPMPRLDLERLVQEIPDRQPLQHQHGALLVGDMVGQLDQFLPGNVAFRGIGAEIVIIGDAIAGMKIGHAGPDRHHLAGGFVAGDERQSRRLVEAGAIVHVDEIEADGMLADAHLAGSRRRHVHRLIDQRFRAPHLVHAHGLGHFGLSLDIRACLAIPSESHRGQVVNSKAAENACDGSVADVFAVALGQDIEELRPRPKTRWRNRCSRAGYEI